MTARISEAVRERVLRCVPHAGSGEVISAYEIRQQLDLSTSTVAKTLADAHRAGRVVRVRKGQYQLAAVAR